MSTAELPSHLLARSIRSGREFGWRKEEFLAVLHAAAVEGYACVGGQFQWVLPGGTCEAYWLNADSAPRLPDEPWSTYVKRAETEVAAGYESLLGKTDLNAEANNWDFLKEKIAEGVPLNEYLIFVAYFNGLPPDA